MKWLPTAFAVAWLAACPAPSRAAERPNIILILADDMGYSDIGSYGGEIQTPNLDRLAAEGIRFTQFYNVARCCPTRAALLTGLYPHQAGVGHMVDDHAKGIRAKLDSPAYGVKLNDRCVTIAEALGAGGYQTFLSGKWHVGSERDAWPDRRGFQRSFGIVGGAMNYFGDGIQHAEGPKAMQLALDGEPWSAPPTGFYATDAFTDRAIQFLRERKARAPFFLYLAYNAPHWPLHALPEDIAKYRGKYLEGWNAIRARRLEKQRAELGAKWESSPRDAAVPDWDALTSEQKAEWDLRMAIYAAQVDRMDQGIGRVLAALRESAAEENTLVLFLSDNGGCAEKIDRGAPGAEMGARDSYSSYRLPWANVSSTPFRLYKHWTHEGGIATPLIARWPRGIARPTISDAPGHVIDLLATCLDVAGVEYPKTFSGRDIQPTEGTSLAPIFAGRELTARNIFWEHEGNRAVREGAWKLVSRFPGAWQLYDLAHDRTELRDLAAEQPEKVRALSAKYDAWAARCGVRPWELTRSTPP